MNVIWSLCLQIECNCVTGIAAGLFLKAERWIGHVAFDLPPVPLNHAQGRDTLLGERAFILYWQGEDGPYPEHCVFSEILHVCGAYWLAHAESFC